MNRLPLVTLLAAAAAMVATPALAGRRHWNGRPGTPIGVNGYYQGTPIGVRGYHPGNFARGRGYRPGVPYGFYGRGRAVPVYGGYYAPQRIFRPAYYPAPLFAGPAFYGAPVIYGGYAQVVPVPVAYGGFPAQIGYNGFPQQGFYDPCRSTGTGAVIGAIAGGLIGNGIAGRYDRGLGTVVGAGLGAVTGTAIERSQRCGY